MMRVLALVPGGIGDQILFFPTLDDIKRSYPDAQINVVVEPRSRGAYRICQSVNNVIPFDFQARNSLADWGNLLGIIRDREYDAVLFAGQSWSMRLLLWLSGVPSRIGFAGGSGETFLTNLVPLKAEQYAAHMYHDLLQGLGLNTPCPELTMSVPKKDIQWAEAQQKELGLEAGYVLIYGGSSQSGKAKDIERYPASSWQQIVTALQKQQPDFPIVVAQGPEDRAWATELLQVCPGLKVTQPEDMGKLTAMIAGANLLLSTDSAPLYLAVAAQTYTIALFDSADPQKRLPASDKFLGIQSPTGKLADIPPKMVLEKILGS